MRTGFSIKYLLPPPNWKFPVVILCGIIVGLSVSLFYLTNAASYLSDKPEACVNCHIMTPHYATWEHSSHRNTASCNDCHVPHNNPIRKYYFKAMDGIRHASIFTLRMEPQVIHIGNAGIEVVQENCLRCHLFQLNPVSAANVNGNNFKKGVGKLCWECHRQTPHGRTLSEASTPFARIPKPAPRVPFWIENLIK